MLRMCWEIIFGKMYFLPNHELNDRSTINQTKEYTESLVFCQIQMKGLGAKLKAILV